MPVRIEALGPGHRPLLTGFQNQHPSLVEYLKRYALRHATKDLLARTFVAIDDAPPSPVSPATSVSPRSASIGRRPKSTRISPACPGSRFPASCSLGWRWTPACRARASGGTYSRRRWGSPCSLPRRAPSRSVSWSLTPSMPPPLGSTNGTGSSAWVTSTHAGWSSTSDQSSSQGHEIEFAVSVRQVDQVELVVGTEGETGRGPPDETGRI